MALRPVRGQVTGTSECSFAEAGRLLRRFLSARKQLLLDAPDIFSQLRVVRDSLEKLAAANPPVKEDNRLLHDKAAEPATGRGGDGKSRDSAGQAKDTAADAEGVGDPDAEQQRKEEKRRRKEERRQRRAGGNGVEPGHGSVEVSAAAETATPSSGGGGAGMSEEEQRQEAKRLRKEERRRKKAAGGVELEPTVGGGVGATFGQGVGVTIGGSSEEEQRKRLKEEKRKAKEERRKAKEAGVVAADFDLSPPGFAGVAGAKRQREELGAAEIMQKRKKVEFAGQGPERATEVGPEKANGKKRKGVESLDAAANGVFVGGALQKEAKRSRREEQAANGVGEVLVGVVGQGVGSEKRMREEGADADGGPSGKKKQKRESTKEDKLAGKWTVADLDGLVAEEQNSKKQRKGDEPVVSPESGVPAEKEEAKRQRKEERKRLRELEGGGGGVGSVGTGVGQQNATVLPEEEARKEKRRRKEEKIWASSSEAQAQTAEPRFGEVAKTGAGKAEANGSVSATKKRRKESAEESALNQARPADESAKKKKRKLDQFGQEGG